MRSRSGFIEVSGSRPSRTSSTTCVLDSIAGSARENAAMWPGNHDGAVGSAERTLMLFFRGGGGGGRKVGVLFRGALIPHFNVAARPDTTTGVHTIHPIRSFGSQVRKRIQPDLKMCSRNYTDIEALSDVMPGLNS